MWANLGGHEGGVDEVLSQVGGRIAGHFARVESRHAAMDYLRGLLSDAPRKNGWRLAEHARHSSPDSVHRLLNGAIWSVDRIRDDIRGYVMEQVGEAAGTLVLGEAGFVKKGDKSAGVAVQYNASRGVVENCQVAVFAAYASQAGRMLVDRELYLPRAWTDNGQRRHEAGIPDGVVYAQKSILAVSMIERACRAGVPFRWVVSDIQYGRSQVLREFCDERDIGSIVGVPAEERMTAVDRGHLSASQIGASLPDHVFERRSHRAGGSIVQRDWAAVGLPDASYARPQALLICKSVSRPDDLAFYRCGLPVGATLTELIRVAESQTTVAECVAEANQRVGLHQYEVRRYEAWYRHVTLAMLANAVLTATRAAIPPIHVSPRSWAH